MYPRPAEIAHRLDRTADDDVLWIKLVLVAAAGGLRFALRLAALLVLPVAAVTAGIVPAL
ncbi:hypothetical protein [Saccharopolyspora sp. NPDC050642]|uniref:hypothetical protein n=1 Tax=Saccharopolyspora sp. NPDC050642 TaxID=3157099 RepID=UPI0033F7FBA8